MWLFAAIDSWRIARLIRSGVNVDGSEDILVQRLSGNPRAWGIILTALGLSFFLQAFLDFGYLMRGLLPILLIGLGVYLLRDYFTKSKEKEITRAEFGEQSGQPMFIGASADARFSTDNFDAHGEYPTEVRSKRWKNSR